MRYLWMKNAKKNAASPVRRYPISVVQGPTGIASNSFNAEL